MITIAKRSVGPYLCVALLLPLLAAAAIGCSSEPPVESVFASNQESVTTIRQFATASVLITEAQTDVPTIEHIAISPGSVVADAGEIVELSARAATEDGRPIDGVSLVWTTVDPRAGSMAGGSAFRAGTTPGVFENAVSVTGFQNTPQGVRFASDSVTVTVVGEVETPTLTSVAILPERPTMLAGQIFRLMAVGFDQNGRVIPGVSFAWQVNNPSLGHVSDIGYLTVLGGQGAYDSAVTVTGVWQGARASKTISVNVVETPGDDDFLDVQILPQSFHLLPGERLQLRAVALGGLGEIADNAEMRWELADPAAGAIDASGVFIAGETPGVYTEAVKVEAAVPGKSGILRAADFASVIVRQPDVARPLKSLRVYPRSLTIGPSARALLIAQPVNDLGHPAREVEIAWEMADPRAGQIDENGSFVAEAAPGRYPRAIRVTASQQLEDGAFTVSESVDVTITGTLARVEIQPQIPTIAPGRSIHFSVRGWDENGVEIAGLVALWSVSDESIGEIDAFGNFTAGDSPGLYEGAIKAEVIQKIPKQQ
ncbi:MAG: hypothetical protein L0177_10655 [Chloroflexi bacterium]|nr:hypothetical protein [Chloroflexota bacterium]